MSERIYRGKRTEENYYSEWVTGYYVSLKDSYKERYSYRIYSGYAESDPEGFYPDYCEVDPETVGQCIGITDKNGNWIFEGDIVKWKDELHEIVYLPKYTRFAARKPHVVFEIIALELSEVVGNIHDNPELIEEWEDVN